MVFGRSKRRTSRPMFPEYHDKNYQYKQVVYYEEGKLYDSNFRMVYSDMGEPEDVLVYLSSRPQICFVESLTSTRVFSILLRCVSNPAYSVFCNNRGVPLVVRVPVGRSSSWIVPISSWDLPAEIESLYVIERTLDHIGLGSSPTPSSLGRKAMRYVYQLHKLKRHTCMPLACEKFVHIHGFGGISVTKHIGSTFSEVSQLDVSSKYLAEFIEVDFPDGTPEWFTETDDLKDFSTWFARVRITIRKSLPLGIFPVRRSDHSVYYPVKKGVYDTYIWKETADIAREWCDVTTFEGWGWHKMTRDNSEWAIWLYKKKLSSPDAEVERKVKKIAVAGIGSLGRDRESYILSASCEKNNEDRGIYCLPMCIGNNPIDLYIVPDFNQWYGLMGHWQKYCVASSNNDVRSFALPFAEKGDLILIETDGIFVKGEEAGQRFLEKHSLEAVGCPPGTWLWKLHHNFRVLRNRMWISDEEPDRYGSLLERILH